MAKFTIDKGQSTVSPAVANTARNMGLSPANRRAPDTLTGNMRPTGSQTTLVPSQLEARGRAGGANRAPVTSNTPSIADSDYARMPGANLPGGVTPVPSRTGTLVSPAGPTGGAGGAGGGSNSGTTTTTETTETAGDTGAASALEAAINQLLEGDFLEFQGERASELRRLQNLRNQLFGDTEFGTTGSVQRQQGLNEQARRRLAAQRAMAGMLQGGAYAGTERGLGTLQRADQDYAMQEMLRPFNEQVMSDRLREFGIEFDPTSRVFNQQELGLEDFATGPFAGREAAARARAAAIQQLAQRGIQI